MRAKLRQTRIDKGLTQEDIAKLCGITRAYYTNIENGRNTPSLSIALKIKKSLGYFNDNLFEIKKLA